MPRLGAIWQVRAGIIPGRVDDSLSKDFALVDGARADVDLFLKAESEAFEYAKELQHQCVNGQTCNWVRVEFVWF